MKNSLFILITILLSCNKEGNNVSTISETDTTEVTTGKNCQVELTQLIPIPEIKTGYYRTYQGGLFPNGSNLVPTEHLNNLLSKARSIQPITKTGTFENTGSIVMIGVGASNPRTEFSAFSNLFAAKLRKGTFLINTCIGGQGVQKMNQLSDTYWQQAYKTLEQNGFSKYQVQAAWIETENTGNGDTSFPTAPLALVQDLKQLLGTMKMHFPNLKLCYLSPRAFAGYAGGNENTVGKGLLWPRDFYNGWAIKWLIENQIQNKPGYTLNELPAISYASYHWSNGSIPRVDGFFLNCNTDLGVDGLHLTSLGEEKVGNLLNLFFMTDTTTQGWLR